jgi:hypothetical protein
MMVASLTWLTSFVVVRGRRVISQRSQYASQIGSLVGIYWSIGSS